LDKQALRHAINFVKTHPWLTIKRDVVKFFNFWQLDRLFPAAAKTGYFGPHPAGSKMLFAAVICGSYAIVLYAGIFGACCRPPNDNRYHLFLVASILFPCAIHTLIFAHSRYNIPVIPLIAVYAAATVVHWRDIWRCRKSLSFGIATIICGVVTLGWLRELLFVDSDLVSRLIG
jgi:hypothetical protein